MTDSAAGAMHAARSASTWRWFAVLVASLSSGALFALDVDRAIDKALVRGNDDFLLVEYAGQRLSIPRRMQPTYFDANSALFFETRLPRTQEAQAGPERFESILLERITVNVNFKVHGGRDAKAIFDSNLQRITRQRQNGAPENHGLRGPNWEGMAGLGDPVYEPVDVKDLARPHPSYYRCTVGSIPKCSTGLLLGGNISLRYEFHRRKLSQWREVHTAVMQSLETVGWK